MGHIVKQLPWCELDIDTDAGHVFMQQRWNYTWRVAPGQPPWTATEKSDFHKQADKHIWASWSNRTTLSVSGSSSFAKKHKTKGVAINVDIRRVTAKEHWNVEVLKIAPKGFRTSHIIWSTRHIKLDTNDFNARVNCVGTPRVCHKQVPVAHEFGHTAGNTVVLGRGDEYKASSPHVKDRSSIMNIGDQLRARHFQTIIDELNKMIPGTSFSVKSIR
jgi:hypothetical protein